MQLSEIEVKVESNQLRLYNLIISQENSTKK